MKEAVRKFKERVEIQSSLFNKIRTHRYFSVGLFIFCSALVLCFHVWQRVQVTSLVYEVALLRQDSEKLLDQKKKLYSKLAELGSSGRIHLYAVDTLGLEAVTADKIYTLKRNSPKITQPDDLDQMIIALKRLGRFFPVVEATQAKANIVEDLMIDSTVNSWDNE